MEIEPTNQEEPTCYGEASLASLTLWLDQQHRANSDDYFRALLRARRASGIPSTVQ